MTTTPAEIARKHRDLHESQDKVLTVQSEKARAKAKAWATLEHAVNVLAKHGCLDTVTITITDTTEPDSNELEHCYSKETQPATATPIKVGDELQEVIAADLPVGVQLTDVDGNILIVTAKGHIVRGRLGTSGKSEAFAPYTVVWVPPTAPEPITLDRLPVGMAEGSAVLSSEAGVMIYMSDDAGCCGPYWRDWQEAGWGTWIKPNLGTLTLLHDAGAKK